MYQIPATVVMERYKGGVDIIGTAEAAICSGAGTKAVSIHQDLMREPQSTQKILKSGDSI